KRSLTEKVPLLLKFQPLGEAESSPRVWIQIISLESERDAQGFETGNFVEGETLALEDVSTGRLETALGTGFYILRVEAPGFQEMNVPIQIRPEEVRGSIKGKSPLDKTLQLIPEEWVPQGGKLIHPTTGLIGHNWYVDGDVVTANSFPMRPYEIKKPLAVSEKPVTVQEYKEFIEDLLRENNEQNGENGAEFKKRLAEIQSYLPRTNIEPEARGRLGQAFNRALQKKNYYWEIERPRVWGGLMRDNVANLVNPLSHPDPFGDPILADQPITAITYLAAEAYLRWRSERDGKNYRMPTVEEMEVFSRNSFDWRFPWGNGPLMPNYVVSRGAFENLDDVSPQPVGKHPLGPSRDRSLYEIVDLLGNTREYASVRGLEGNAALFGGSVRMLFGSNFKPSARYLTHVNQVLDSGGSFRWVLDLTEPPSE
ncbi:MAG: SUMF1/EgtB/PvdO family nonheme iron enzyme, partial [bacterium]|nr:SUMF1/EgtB/PvdO family nonheme iron enzyme [bacterium]